MIIFPVVNELKINSKLSNTNELLLSTNRLNSSNNDNISNNRKDGNKNKQSTTNYHELDIIRSIHISRVLQLFDVTFSYDNNLVPSITFLEFLKIHVSKDLSEKINLSLDEYYHNNKDYISNLEKSTDQLSYFLSILYNSPVILVKKSNGRNNQVNNELMKPRKGSKIGNMYSFDKLCAKRFLTEYLSKSSLKISETSATPEFILDQFLKERENLPYNMPLEKRLKLIETTVSDAQQAIDVLMSLFQTNDREYVNSFDSSLNIQSLNSPSL